MRYHDAIDRRSLAMHQLAAEKIRRQPQLFEQLSQTLARWQDLVSPSTQPYIREWESLVRAGMEPCLAVATEESERGNALRQSSPFMGILTHQERFALIREWRDRDAA